jgi:hypothetical protein
MFSHALPERKRQFAEPPLNPIRFDVREGLTVPGAPLLERHWAWACASMSSRLILSYRA